MSSSPYPLHLQAAERELGIQEIKGGQHNPRILAYHAATSLAASDDETPWCASFVNWCLEVTGQRGTQSATARSFLTWGHSVAPEAAQPGDIAVFKRGSSPWQGHVGFFVGWDGSNVRLLGGNQNDSVSLASYPSTGLLGIRRAA
jgi:uncharacterized protein (TIGR02594 family)